MLRRKVGIASKEKVAKRSRLDRDRLTGTPAKYIGRVYAATEAQAIERAIAEYRVPPEQHKRLVARREG